MPKDVISLSISVLLLFRHYISHKITFGAPSSDGVLCSACGAFIFPLFLFLDLFKRKIQRLSAHLTSQIKSYICNEVALRFCLPPLEHEALEVQK